MLLPTVGFLLFFARESWLLGLLLHMYCLLFLSFVLTGTIVFVCLKGLRSYTVLGLGSDATRYWLVEFLRSEYIAFNETPVTIVLPDKQLELKITTSLSTVPVAIQNKNKKNKTAFAALIKQFESFLGERNLPISLEVAYAELLILVMLGVSCFFMEQIY